MFCESRMLHPAFGVMSQEDLIFFLGNAQTGEIREQQVLSSLSNVRESVLPLLWHFNEKRVFQPSGLAPVCPSVRRYSEYGFR